MRIAVNTRFVIKDKLEGIGWFSKESSMRMAADHPEHEFLFLFDRNPDPSFVSPDNVIGKSLAPQARHPFLWSLWFEYAVPIALNRNRADLFVSLDGFCSLKTSVPTYMVVHDLAFEHFADHVPGLVQRYYKKYSPRYAAKAHRIGTVSKATKDDVVNLYGVNPDKIDVLHNGAGEVFQPVSATRIREVQKHYLGKEQPYFVYVGSLNPRKNIVRLFQAFDAYAEQKPAGCRLVVAGKMAWKSEEIQKTYEHLKHKDRVLFTGHLGSEELAELVGSAKAMVYPSLFEGFGIPVLEAMYADVPVITSNCSSMPEVAGQAALLVDPHSEHAITEAMLRIDSEQELRNSLIVAGRVQRMKFSWDQTAKRMWTGIEKMMAEL